MKRSIYVQALYLTIPLAIIAIIAYIAFISLAFGGTGSLLSRFLGTIFLYFFFPVFVLANLISPSGLSIVSAMLMYIFELVWLYILSLIILFIYKKIKHKS